MVYTTKKYKSDKNSMSDSDKDRCAKVVNKSLGNDEDIHQNKMLCEGLLRANTRKKVLHLRIGILYVRRDTHAPVLEVRIPRNLSL